MTGRKAYVTMRREFKKDGVNLEDYAVDNGGWIKENEIEPPMIKATEYLQFGKTYENVHHLDFHSSYPGGLANHYPEMRKTIERIYSLSTLRLDSSNPNIARSTNTVMHWPISQETP